jgi:hypothetical protein
VSTRLAVAAPQGPLAITRLSSQLFFCRNMFFLTCAP